MSDYGSQRFFKDEGSRDFVKLILACTVVAAIGFTAILVGIYRIMPSFNILQ